MSTAATLRKVIKMMKNALMLITPVVATAMLLTGACSTSGSPATTPQTTKVQELIVVDTVRPATPDSPSQKRVSATSTPIPTLTPTTTATPMSQSRSGLGVTRYSVQSGLEEVGFSFVSQASTGTVYGDSEDGTATVKLFAPEDTLREAIIQFYYTPALKPDSVVLNSLLFTNLVLPDWIRGGEWLANGFDRAANGESAETSVSTANGKAHIVLEIIGADTISLAITSSDTKNYALEILGVTPTRTATPRNFGITQIAPKPITEKVSGTPYPTNQMNIVLPPPPTPEPIESPCDWVNVMTDPNSTEEEKYEAIQCANKNAVEIPLPTPEPIESPCDWVNVMMNPNSTQEEKYEAIQCSRKYEKGLPRSTRAPHEYTTYTDFDALEERMHEIINAARGEQGLAELAFDETARDIARAHSEDVVSHEFITNTELAGSYEYCATWVHQSKIYHSREAQSGQRIPTEWRTPEELAQTVVEGWLKSTEGHREAVLDPYFHKMGVGIAISDEGEIFFTQIFC